MFGFFYLVPIKDGTGQDVIAYVVQRFPDVLWVSVEKYNIKEVDVGEKWNIENNHDRTLSKLRNCCTGETVELGTYIDANGKPMGDKDRGL